MVSTTVGKGKISIGLTVEKGGTTSSGSPKADKNSLQYDNTIVKNVWFVCILIQPQVLQYENFDLDTIETPVNIELFKQLLMSPSMTQERQST